MLADALRELTAKLLATTKAVSAELGAADPA
jgi:hypothetical protein